LHPLDDIFPILDRSGRAFFIYNYQFSAFNSRLGAHKFPSKQQRELAGKRLISLVVLGAKAKVLEDNQRAPVTTGKTGNSFPWSNAEEIEETAARTILQWFR
jgi:hypothetical protein